MFGMGTTEIIIIAAVLFMFFGSKKLVEFASGLGKTKKELGKIKKELGNESDSV